MKKHILIFITLLLLTPVAFAEYLTLTYPDSYWVEDGLYHKMCAEKAGGWECDMYITLTKYDNATNNTISWDAHLQNSTNSSHWYWVDFSSYVTDFTIWVNDTHVNGTGNWSIITSGDAWQRLQGQSEGYVEYRRYSFTLTQPDVDLIPTYWVNDSYYKVYSEYAVFTDFDLGGTLLSYVAWDTDANIDTAGNVTTFGLVTWEPQAATSAQNWRNNTGDGREVTGSWGRFDFNTDEYISSTATTNLDALLPNDTATITMYTNYTANAATNYLVDIRNQGKVILITATANDTINVLVRDDAFDSFAFDAPPINNGSFIHTAFVFQDDAAGTTVTVYYDGVQVAQGSGSNVDNIWTSTCNAALSSTQCWIGATDFGGPTGYWKGGFDEFRFYSTALDQTQIQSLATLQFAVAPSFNEEMQNATYEIGTNYGWTLNVTSDNDFDAYSNSSNIIAVANNGSKTVDVTYTPSAIGSEVVQVTVSNLDGSANTQAAYTITATVSVLGFDVCENVSDTGKGICGVMSGAGKGMGSLINNLKSPVVIFILFLGIGAVALGTFGSINGRIRNGVRK